MAFRYHTPDTILTLYPDGGVTYLMRHAERYPFRQPGDAIMAGLTNNGIRQAREFGVELAKNCQISRVRTSPLERCIDTGSYVLEGAGSSQIIHGHWWLFSPFLRVKHDEVNGIQLQSGQSSEKPDSTYLPEKLNILTRRIQAPQSKGEIFLYVAHDTTIMPLLAYLLGFNRIYMQQAPGYMEGIAFVQHNGCLKLDNPEFYQTD